MSQTSGIGLVRVVETAFTMIPLGNVCEAIGHNLPPQAKSIVKTCGQIMQIAGGTLLVMPFTGTVGGKILFGITLLPLCALVTNAIFGKPSIVKQASNALRIGFKIANIAALVFVTPASPIIGISLIGVCIYNLATEELLKNSVETVTQKARDLANRRQAQNQII